MGPDVVLSSSISSAQSLKIPPRGAPRRVSQLSSCASDDGRMRPNSSERSTAFFDNVLSGKDGNPGYGNARRAPRAPRVNRRRSDDSFAEDDTEMPMIAGAACSVLNCDVSQSLTFMRRSRIGNEIDVEEPDFSDDLWQAQAENHELLEKFQTLVHRTREAEAELQDAREKGLGHGVRCERTGSGAAEEDVDAASSLEQILSVCYRLRWQKAIETVRLQIRSRRRLAAKGALVEVAAAIQAELKAVPELQLQLDGIRAGHDRDGVTEDLRDFQSAFSCELGFLQREKQELAKRVDVWEERFANAEESFCESFSQRPSVQSGMLALTGHAGAASSTRSSRYSSAAAVDSGSFRGELRGSNSYSPSPYASEEAMASGSFRGKLASVAEMRRRSDATGRSVRSAASCSMALRDLECETSPSSARDGVREMREELVSMKQIAMSLELQVKEQELNHWELVKMRRLVEGMGQAVRKKTNQEATGLSAALQRFGCCSPNPASAHSGDRPTGLVLEVLEGGHRRGNSPLRIPP